MVTVFVLFVQGNYRASGDLKEPLMQGAKISPSPSQGWGIISRMDWKIETTPRESVFFSGILPDLHHFFMKISYILAGSVGLLPGRLR
ncbi:MAG: hypothetical protein K6360_08350 [Deltaproteobacteria bacterium]